MDTFSIIRNALAASENDPNKAGLAQDIVDTARIVAAVQVVVDALTPPDRGRYIVGFKDIATAGTSLADHTVTVSSKPLRDPNLSIIEKAVVIATFAAHEIGHTFVTYPRRYPVDVVKAHNAHSGYHTVANIADDIILEPFMVDRYPILKDAFDFTGAWVLRNTAKSLPVTPVLHHGTSAAERFNIVLSATRYGDIPEIVWTEGKMTEERDWCRDWKARLIALPINDNAAFVAACDEVWEHIRVVDPEPEPEPEPEDDEDEPEPEPEGEDEDEPEPLDDNPNGTNDQPVEDEPEPEDGEDEPEPEPGECEPDPDEGEPEPNGPGGDEPGTETSDEQPQGDDFDEEPEDEDEDGEPAPGESEDEDEPVETEPTDEGGEDEDEDGEESDDPTPGGDEPTDDDTDTDEDTEREPEVRSEDDFNGNEVDKTTHDQAEQVNYDGDLIERQVRQYANTTSVAFGKHGHMSTTWD